MAGYSMQIIGDKGFGLIATKPYSPGDIIFEEKPLVSSQFAWNATYKYLACELCLKPLETAEQNIRRLANNQHINLPYPDMCPTISHVNNHTSCLQCGVKYCSNECLIEASNKYHKVLCLGNDVNNLEHPLNKLIEMWKKIHYPPETFNILMIAKIFAIIKQSDYNPEIVSKFNEFQSKTTNEKDMIIHKVLGENFNNDLKMLYDQLCLIFNAEDYTNLLKFDQFISIFAMIGTNGQGVGTNPFSTWVKNVSDLDLPNADKEKLDSLIDNIYLQMDEVSGEFLNSEGSALYSIQSKINHNCHPNAEVCFPYSNYVLVLTSLEEIKPGDEICISYLDECFLDRSRHSRQKFLRENYLFSCNCEKCEEQKNDPDVTSDEEEEISDTEMME